MTIQPCANTTAFCCAHDATLEAPWVWAATHAAGAQAGSQKREGLPQLARPSPGSIRSDCHIFVSVCLWTAGAARRVTWIGFCGFISRHRVAG